MIVLATRLSLFFVSFLTIENLQKSHHFWIFDFEFGFLAKISPEKKKEKKEKKGWSRVRKKMVYF
jgi:hypothetical protein